MTLKNENKFRQKTLLIFINEARSLYDRKHFTDVTLECEGEIFPVHKLVLAANSPYFRDYLTQNENLHLKNMSVDFMTSEVLQEILHYFYTGRILNKKEHSPRLLKSIIEASSVLEIPLLSSHCLELLLSKTTREISVSDWKLIKELNSKLVSDIFLQNVVYNIASLNTTQEFLQLSVSQVKELFQCQAVAKANQNIIFQSILNWIKYNSDGRKELLTEFLEKYVDLEKLNLLLLSELENDELLIENTYFVMAYIKLMSQEMNIEVRKSGKIKPQRFSKQKKDIPNSLEKQGIKLITEDYSENRSFRNDMKRFEVVLAKKQFFIYGFKEKNTGESLIYLYDYETDKLNEIIAHPLRNRKDAAILYHKGNVYAFGSRTLDEICTSRVTFSYNTKTEQWLEKNWLLKYRHSSAAIELNGYLYVIGGFDSKSDILNCMECYNPSLNIWKSVDKLPDFESTTLVVVAVTDYLFAWVKPTLYKYIPGNDKWESVDIELSEFMNIEGQIHMCSGQDTIYIIEKEDPKAVWIYDPKQNSIKEDIIPTVLTECDGIINLKNPEYLEFLVSGSKKWFIYRPVLHSWSPFNPKRLKDFQISMLTLIDKPRKL